MTFFRQIHPVLIATAGAASSDHSAGQNFSGCRFATFCSSPLPRRATTAVRVIRHDARRHFNGISCENFNPMYGSNQMISINSCSKTAVLA
jgi:hypothetical protein